MTSNAHGGLVDAIAAVLDGAQWQRYAHSWPVTFLMALELVQAAREQSRRASEALDGAFRGAMHHVIREVAEYTPGVGAFQLDEALRDGGVCERIFTDLEVSLTAEVEGSPHLFLPDGTDIHNPAVIKEWSGQPDNEGYRGSPRTTRTSTTTCRRAAGQS